MITDGYAQWYSDRLWNLLPPVYKLNDQGPTAGAPGPLRELINRIGTQAAVLRRNTDRLWENQSIETCDDWVIPYIGTLVATRLVSCLDAAAQRVDVAKTIYYRRRAGTVGVLEELAADIASRDARVVEFFRRMARTRHQFDPPLSYQIENPFTGPIGLSGAQNGANLRGVWSPTSNYFPNDEVTYYNVSYLAGTANTGKEPDQNPSIWQALPQQQSLEVVEGLIGAYSGTPAGGFADLRNTYAASNTGNAFDEYFYTADLRAGGETLGHFNIRNLGVFIWWLQAFPISAATPVSNKAAKPCLTFDPTGREIPLFAASQRVGEQAQWGEHWVSPDEWELPVAIRETLWATAPDELYSTDFTPQAFSVGMIAGGTGAALPLNHLKIHPERGTFSFVNAKTQNPEPAPVGTLAVCYNFGLLGQVGGGAFDTSLLSPLTLPATTANISGGDTTNLNPILGAVTGTGTLLFNDSLTYKGPSKTLTVPAGATVALAAVNGQRPVLRWSETAAQKWEIQGKATSGSTTPTQLVIQGLLLQGADLVLTGSFDNVYLRMATVDPGSIFVAQKGVTPPTPPPLYASAIDGMPLRPSVIYIEGSVTNFIVERCITGAIRTSGDGAVTSLQATASIVQSIPTHTVGSTVALSNPVFFDPASLANALKFGTSPQAQAIVASSSTLANLLEHYSPANGVSKALRTAMLSAIGSMNEAEAEQLWPLALADLALGFDEGTVSLTQCTVMGMIVAHILSASKSILDNVATADDTQDGCVRFSSYASGSSLHQPYRSVVTAAHPSIFVSRNFGDPGYVQLRSDADNQILSAAQSANACICAADSVQAAQSILTGAENGAEMGVYSSEVVALKRRGLVLKYEEYAPIGQLPVWIDAD